MLLSCVGIKRLKIEEDLWLKNQRKKLARKLKKLANEKGDRWTVPFFYISTPSSFNTTNTLSFIDKSGFSTSLIFSPM